MSYLISVPSFPNRLKFIFMVSFVEGMGALLIVKTA